MATATLTSLNPTTLLRTGDLVYVVQGNNSYQTTMLQLINCMNGNPQLFTGLAQALPTGANTRFAIGKGWQLWNQDTAKWHTLLCVGSPFPTLALDTGTST